MEVKKYRKYRDTFNTSERPSVNSMNALQNTNILSWITTNSAQLYQYHYTLTKLAILLTTVHLILIELIRCKCDSVRKAREAHLINKAKTKHLFGINRRDEAPQWHIRHLFTNSLPIIVTYFY